MQVEMLETLVNERGEVKKNTKNIAVIIANIVTIFSKRNCVWFLPQKCHTSQVIAHPSQSLECKGGRQKVKYHHHHHHHRHHRQVYHHHHHRQVHHRQAHHHHHNCHHWQSNEDDIGPIAIFRCERSSLTTSLRTGCLISCCPPSAFPFSEDHLDPPLKILLPLLWASPPPRSPLKLRCHTGTGTGSSLWAWEETSLFGEISESLYQNWPLEYVWKSHFPSFWGGHLA